ncbi:MAG: sulfatase [Planctomycetota bacterium]|jgi:arylsulfatase A-like enzyme
MRPLTTLITTALLAAASFSFADNPPNILLVTFDDMNDWIGCLDGHPQAQTPHLDRLAKRGVLFTRAHCASPVCSGSRAANFTGLMPVNNGVYGNGQRIEKTLPNAVYLPQDLARQGYHTMGTGKLLHGDTAAIVHEYGVKHQKYLPITDEELIITPEELADNKPYVRHEIPRLGITMPLNQMPRDRDRGSNRIDSFDWGPIDAPEEEFTDAQIAMWAVNRLRRHHDKPFFLGVGIYRPHQPLWAPKKYHDLYPPESIVLPEVKVDDLDDLGKVAQAFGRYPITSGAHKTVVENGQWRNAVSAYLACISFADAMLGKVINALDNSPYADNTMIVVWSDHGWQLGEKEHWGKFTTWQRSTRVPLIIVPPRNAQPEGFTPGTTSHRVVSLVDVYPTIIDTLGLKMRDDLDGVSLKPLIADPDAPWDRVAISSVGRGNHTVRHERWHYTRYFDGTEELYDFRNDPHEWYNLAGRPEHAEIQDWLRAQLPTDDGFKHFVRYGDYKAAVPESGEIMLYGPGAEIVDERKNVADKNPMIVKRIERYLKEHPEAPKHLAMPSGE